MAVLALQVEGQAPLVGVVGGVEGVAVLVGGAGHGGAGAASGVAEAGLHLDDVGTPVGQDAGRAGAGDEVGQVNDFYAFQRLKHNRKLLSIVPPAGSGERRRGGWRERRAGLRTGWERSIVWQGRKQWDGPPGQGRLGKMVKSSTPTSEPRKGMTTVRAKVRP